MSGVWAVGARVLAAPPGSQHMHCSSSATSRPSGDQFDAKRSEAHYRKALALAEHAPAAPARRPLPFGLVKLHRQRADAGGPTSISQRRATMYREMGIAVLARAGLLGAAHSRRSRGPSNGGAAGCGGGPAGWTANHPCDRDIHAARAAPICRRETLDRGPALQEQSGDAGSRNTRRGRHLGHPSRLVALSRAPGHPRGVRASPSRHGITSADRRAARRSICPERAACAGGQSHPRFGRADARGSDVQVWSDATSAPSSTSSTCRGHQPHVAAVVEAGGPRRRDRTRAPQAPVNLSVTTLPEGAPHLWPGPGATT